MTVASQVKQTIASLKGTKATLDTFYQIEQNEENRQLLEKNSRRISQVIDNLEKRVRALEYEEPQYKGL
ncbi:DUF1657 domain-containing protein [Desulforamulus putei]|uniref:DUF1657 domain-containing protein n=1 Tax=Desulforamulus putei DSM 12395 TaxID=1121429 RepID=A0A1M4SDG5_9FIRM|nr:DUF1657 domain-containing protein [Desulforamulus putei]SHE30273.1 Protein of unknown function [Desulforamulus putei DSM 12395]